MDSSIEAPRGGCWARKRKSAYYLTYSRTVRRKRLITRSKVGGESRGIILELKESAAKSPRWYEAK
jgi:hypothetical protein